MRHILFKLALFFLLVFIPYTGLAQEETISYQFGPSLEIGREELIFGIIAGVCEDDEGNFYVLDRAEHKVFKFSQDGKFLVKFGSRGEGPGDFRGPNRITYTAEKNIVVCDDMYFVSFFQTDGSFIKRIEISGRLAPGYIGEDRFYGWVWLPEGQQQVVVDGKNDVIHTFHTISRDSFSVSAPDSSGRLVMFNYGKDEFAPSFIFSHNKNYAALGISIDYDILILNNEGEIYSHIQRDIKPDKFSKNETEYFSDDLKALAKKRGWPDKVVKDLEKIIPDEKTFFNQVLLSGDYVYVFRIAHDITKEDDIVPVDIFTLQGQFIGTADMDGLPIYISKKKIYFVRSENDGTVYLVIKKYEKN